ncbi:MAG: lysophospholipid acyltransferase family protein [Anaerolineae bacterium]
MRILFRAPARTFATQILEFDQAIAPAGLNSAALGILPHYIRSLRVFGADRVPASAFLALSNHPGMTDTLALFAALNRPDLKIIALDRPFLKALPNVSRQLFYVTEDPARRMTLVRQVSAHLRAGGAVLTFPAGHIEPDPAVYPGAVESLESWTDSVGVFLRLAPQTAVLPVLVRGVVWEKIARHPILRLAKTKKEEREKLAAALQLLTHVSFGGKDVHVEVHIGQPIYVHELRSNDSSNLHQAILATMQQMIEQSDTGPAQWLLR